MTDQPSRFLTLDEVAEELGLSRTQVFSERTTTLATTDPAATPYTGHPLHRPNRTTVAAASESGSAPGRRYQGPMISSRIATAPTPTAATMPASANASLRTR